ncbi:hypothetical protein [Endozoicomonas sp. 8E]|uniref:hypothetical protein n=1 Tax=Endozoicomonas sp. 8E TaxID=3035692 RepID=UPI002938FE9D|nr:hypothetical protein [Endozoicomonas sp. 8E]WOG27433.1 hypothetical protein P6910_23245 [Endozoicomonas sp. 8E]
MNKSLIRDRNRQSLTLKKESSVLLLSLVVCFSNGSNWASTIELNNNNFREYLNADHPVEGYYQLLSDIDLSQFTPWKPIGNTSIPFSLTLYGNGHVISGLKVSTSTHNTASGLFGSLQNSTIRQILFKQPKVTSTGFTSPAGALVGELKGSRIEEVVNYAGTVRASGPHSHSGGLAGSVSDSVIHDSVNTGTVLTIIAASAGGIAGWADQTSSLSNNLNTGKITSRILYSSSPAGGIVGTLKNNSIANNNINTGEVNVGYTEYSGGVAGEVEASKVLHNLNTGKVSSDYLRSFCFCCGEGGSSGGIVGHASGQTLVSKNLNTGSIFTKYWRTYAGGIAGDVVNATVVQNVNAGTVTTQGPQASAGGITGEAEGTSVKDNLNVGAIRTKGVNGHIGAISGAATLSASVCNNVNTGSVEAQRNFSYVSGAAARVWKAGRIEHNLDTFTKYQWTSERGSGRNKGVVRLSKSTLKSNLTGLNSTLWNAGDASQLPMLKGINIPYRELARISAAKTNRQFPTALNEFADPGGFANATSFNPGVWNARSGYLPFLLVFSKSQTLLAGIDCTQGGFDCSADNDIPSTPAAAQPLPPHSPGLSSHCPPPKGTPLLQAYDPENQHIYVVIQAEPSSEWAPGGIILARYKGPELDQQFGLCGTVTYTTASHHARILSSYPSLSAQVIHKPTGSSLKIIAMTKSGKTTLFEFPLTPNQKYRAQFNVKLNPAAASENDNRKLLTISNIDTVNCQLDILVQNDQTYVATYDPGEEKLSIRRFAADSGEMDSTFIIDDWIDFSSRPPDSFTTVRLMTTEGYLHAIIYNSDGQLSVFSYEDQVNVHRFDTTFKPATAKSMRLVFVGNKAYLAIENSDSEEGSRQIRMQEISLGLESYDRQKPCVALRSAESSAVISDWLTELIAGGAVVATAAVAVILVIYKFKRPGMQTSKLRP